MLFGGETSDQVLVPHQPEKSLIIAAVEWSDPNYEMPPKKNDRLTQEQVQWIRKWIKSGAPWPDEETQTRHRLKERSKKVTDEGILIETSGGQSEDWTYRRYQKEDLSLIHI